jgi:oxaloacetate decarboxylase alpha subunit
LESAIRAAKDTKSVKVQGAIVYTISPIHTMESFTKGALELQDMGVDSLCIKDMSGLLSPYDAYNLIRMLKKHLHIPIELHTHCTCGFGEMTYMKAIEAGVDIIDTALSPFGEVTSQPATETMVMALENSIYDTGIDVNRLWPLTEHFKKVRKELSDEFQLTMPDQINPAVRKYQIPGGMLTNLYNQLKGQGAEDRFDDVLAEMPNVRRDLGYPPLVTPTSQITGSEAALNVLYGRYKIITNEVRDIVQGKYGRVPGTISADFRKMCIGDEKVIDYRPADDLKPELEKARQALAEEGFPNASREDVLSYTLFPEVALPFFKKRRGKETVASNQ